MVIYLGCSNALACVDQRSVPIRVGFVELGLTNKRSYFGLNFICAVILEALERLELRSQILDL